MFQSYEYIKYLPEIDEYLYKIIDDEGWEAEIGTETTMAKRMGAAAVAVKVYSKKGKSVEEIGMNIAILILYCKERWQYSTTDNIIEWQDQYCSKHIDNWDQIKEQRDRHLQLLQLFQ